MPIQNRKAMGTVLVALQFGLLLLLIVLAAPAVMTGSISIGALLMVGTSIGLAGWTLLHNRVGNFNIHPAPKERGELITTGPYRLIRHPMYTSVLLGGAALAMMSNPLLGWTAWLALLLVLYVKAAMEEQWVLEHHPSYGSYMQKAKRFVPWLV